MAETVAETNFQNLPGMTGEVYHGKVRDTYTVEHKMGELMVAVCTDRVSAFDVILPRLIPYKGQVLNQMSAYLLQKTAGFAPNWFIESPDPNVTIGYKAEPFKVEMIMRSHLLGTAWRKYDKEGMRQLCDNVLPEGMEEFQAFETPILTPTSKAEGGAHDENITRQEILDQGLATADEYEIMSGMAHSLFTKGQIMAERQGLIMPDTKYEIGKLATGQIVVIDEIHTPDSSRYFDKEPYDSYLNSVHRERPEQKSKEFVREWLIARDFMNEPGQTMPELTDEFVSEITLKYIAMYEQMTDLRFVAAGERDIEANITESLRKLAA